MLGQATIEEKYKENMKDSFFYFLKKFLNILFIYS